MALILDNVSGFAFGFFVFSILEPFIINFVYFSNIDLMFDIGVISKKNKERLRDYFEKK